MAQFIRTHKREARGVAIAIAIAVFALILISAFSYSAFTFASPGHDQAPDIDVDEISDDFGNSYASPFPTFDCDANPLFGEVTIIGSGVGSAPPGQVQQYGVEVDWGDSTVEEVNSTFDPASGNHVNFSYEFDGSHLYANDGQFDITVKLFHSQGAGQDNQADDTFSFEVCIEVKPPTTATLIIEKITNPSQSEESFEFGTSWDGTFFLSDGDTEIFDTLTEDENPYDVTETVSDGWTLTGASCSGDEESGWDTITDGVTVDLVAGETVTCTFTNTQEAEPVDLCTNIEGDQSEIPEGYEDPNEDGICTEIEEPVDLCINIEGDQSEIPEGLEDPDEDGICTEIEEPVDLCTNIEGDQSEIPEGYEDPDEDGICTEQSNGGGGGGGETRIRGMKWNDENGNGLPDNNENGLTEWTIELYQDDQLVDSTVTDGSSNYEFDVEPGDYEVCEVQKEGWTQTYPADNGCHNVSVSDEETVDDVDFGNRSEDGGGSSGGGGGGGGSSSGGGGSSPTPQVLGAQIAQVPQGAPNTGMGGTAQAATGMSVYAGFFSLILGLAGFKFSEARI